MRTIGQLASEDFATRFSDFLTVRGIDNQVDPEEDGGFSLWVIDDAHLALAAELFRRFQANPDAAEFQGAAEAVARQQRALAKAEARRRSTVADSARLGYERAGPNGTPYLTYGLILISVAVAIYSHLGDDHQALQILSITNYHVVGNQTTWLAGLPEVSRGQIWRLVTPMFIHFGLPHILFNMLMLKDLGTFIEARFNSRYLLVLVLISAALSNYGQFLSGGPWFGGMSGVDFALFGFLWMRGKHDRAFGWELNRNTVQMVVGWFLICLVGIIPNVANMAHGVGLAVGMAWGYLSARRPFSR